jgi:invasion protein IalB
VQIALRGSIEKLMAMTTGKLTLRLPTPPLHTVGILCIALCAMLTGLVEAGFSQAFAGAASEGESDKPPLPPQFADGTVKGQYGDWQFVCKPPPPGAKNEVCALVQSVTAEDRPNVGLTIYFQQFSNGVRVLRVFAPVGILLPPGVGLKIDGADIGHAPFLRCHTFACYAQVTVEEKLIEQMKTGKTAIFIIFQTEEAGIGIPISLAGFNEGLAALSK